MHHANHRPALDQQKRIQREAEKSDSYAFFNLLTSLRMLDGVENLLPKHRERLFPPTETLSMFLGLLPDTTKHRYWKFRCLRLMAMHDIPMTLYSSDLIKANFAGGSINADNSPAILAALEQLRTSQPAATAFFIAGSRWDQHLMRQIPALRHIIGDNAGRQFTPADPIVVVGMTTPDLGLGLVLAQRPVRVRIDLDDLDPARGYRVQLHADTGANIQLVDSIDTALFRRRVIDALRRLR